MVYWGAPNIQGWSATLSPWHSHFREGKPPQLPAPTHSNSFSAPKHTLSLAFLSKKTYPFSCIFCQNHTLDVGRHTRVTIYIVSAPSGESADWRQAAPMQCCLLEPASPVSPGSKQQQRLHTHRHEGANPKSCPTNRPNACSTWTQNNHQGWSATILRMYWWVSRRRIY